MTSRSNSVLIRVICGSIFFFSTISPAPACPMCLGGKTLGISAQELIYAPHSVLAEPNPEKTGFRIVAVIKGEADQSDIMEKVLRADAAAPRSSEKPLLLIRDDNWPSWVNFGAIDASQATWLKHLSTGQRSTRMNHAEWCAHLADLCESLDSPEPMVSGIAIAEFENAPYATLRSLKPKLDPIAIRKRLNDPALSNRRALDTLLLGIAGGPDDANEIETQLDSASKSHSTLNLTPLIAANLELRGPSRLAWIHENYLVDAQRTEPEIEATILALGQHGEANAKIPRDRVVEVYRTFLTNHPEHAGLVATDLANWQCWEFAKEFAELTNPSIAHCSAEHEAILDFLRRSTEAAKP